MTALIGILIRHTTTRKRRTRLRELDDCLLMKLELHADQGRRMPAIHPRPDRPAPRSAGAETAVMFLEAGFVEGWIRCRQNSQ